MAWNIFKKQKDAMAAREEARTAAVPVPLPGDDVSPRQSVPPRQGLRGGAAKFPVSAQNIFIRPLVTEKSLMHARHDVYVFEVRPDATKITIKKAFANLYGTMPTGVRVAHQQGKVVRFGRREGKRKDWKKAFITVAKGTTIDIQ